MPEKDGYGEFEDRRSRFFGYAFRIGNSEHFENRLRILRVEHPKARHHCWAWRLAAGPYRFTDDGEPGGTAGKPILQAIEGYEVEDCGVIVVRYFGGVKLGTGGLVRAYSGAAQTALQSCGRLFLERRVCMRLHLDFQQLAFRQELEAVFPKLTWLTEEYLDTGWLGEASLPIGEQQRLESFVRDRGRNALRWEWLKMDT